MSVHYSFLDRITVFRHLRGCHVGDGGDLESITMSVYMYICSVMSNSLRPHGLYSPWNSPCQNTGVGSLSLLQGIFPIQGSNPGLPHCGQILYQLSHKGNPLRVRRGSRTGRSAQKAKEGNRPSHHLQSRVLILSKCW